MPGSSVLYYLLKFSQIRVHWVSDAIYPSYPLLPPLLLPSIFPSIRVFSNSSAPSIRWPKCWSFSFIIISLSSEYSGLTSFKTDWFDLLAVQGTLESHLQYHNYLVKGLNIIICSGIRQVIQNEVTYWSWGFSAVSERKTLESPLDCKEIKSVKS